MIQLIDISSIISNYDNDFINHNIHNYNTVSNIAKLKILQHHGTLQFNFFSN